MKTTIYRIPSSELQDLFLQYSSFYYWTPSQGLLRKNESGSWEDPIAVQDIMQHLSASKLDAPVFIDGLIDYEITPSIRYHILDADLREDSSEWIFLTRIYVDIPQDLLPFVRQKSWILPTAAQTADYLITRGIHDDRMVRAASGLYIGELRRILNFADPGKEFEAVATYKEDKLKQKGILHISKPDVHPAGVENVITLIEEAAETLSPAAKAEGIPFPKGMGLIGPPGTGKSLSAKAAATIMGVPLICIDWGRLISDKPGESEDNIRTAIEMAEAIAPSIIFFDDVDKVFVSDDLSRENAVEKRIVGYLLTWMQERQSDVYTILTCNRVEQIPAELKRRLTDIVFVDLPHEGGRFEIFKAHLDRYKISHDGWERSQWKEVITAYNECTPDELGRSVDRAVRRRRKEGSILDMDPNYLLWARTQFTPANIANNAQIEAIRANSACYRRAASDDNSEYKVNPEPAFQKILGTRL